MKFGGRVGQPLQIISARFRRGSCKKPIKKQNRVHKINDSVLRNFRRDRLIVHPLGQGSRSEKAENAYQRTPFCEVEHYQCERGQGTVLIWVLSDGSTPV